MMAPHWHTRPFQKPSAGKCFNPREIETAVQWEHSRLNSFSVLIFLLAAFASVNLVASQEPKQKQNTSQNPGFVLQQTVRRVRVDVVVTDAQGHPVAGLPAAGFHVAEDGKPQSIRQFDYHDEENVQSALPKRPPLPPHTFMNLPTVTERGPLTVVLFDALNTRTGDQLYARAQMLEFVKQSSGRRLAIFYLGDRLRLLQGFTSDTDLLLQATKQTLAPSLMGYQAEITGYPTTATDPTAPPTTGSCIPSGHMTDAQAAEQCFATVEENTRLADASQLQDRRVKMTLDALMDIGRFLEDLPGRKNLIWYSGSFPASIFPDPNKAQSRLPADTLVRDDSDRNYTESVKKATNLLNSAEVSIYPVDARGLLTDIPFAQKAAEFGTMDMLGEQTGGQAFYNTNGLKEVLEKAADEGSSYYSLVYAPTNMKFDGKLRRISVRLEHGDYHLAYRRSYFADDLDSANRQAAGDEEHVSAESMPTASQFGSPSSHQLVFAVHVDAVGTLAPATAEQMAALAPYEQRAALAEHRQFVQPKNPVQLQQYAIQFGVLAKQLDLPKSADGIYHSDLSIAALAFDEDGATLWGTQSQVKEAIPAAKLGEFRKSSVETVQTIFLPENTAAIHVVVRDEQSGRIGSMEIPLPLPPDQPQTSGVQ
jgi:VWFA-related protein